MTEYLDRYPTMHEYAEGKRINPRLTDLISRADAIKAVAEHFSFDDGCSNIYKDIDYYKGIAEHILKNVPSALPSAEAKGANLINRHDATTVIREECWKCNNLINADLLGRILALPTSRQTDCTEFIEWLIEVILDDEDWELNAVSYGEVIAREMKKLGLLEVKDGYYFRPSADAVPTVIRAKTFMRKEDFDKWAEDIKKQNKSIVCIPCDAEVVSADAVQGEWIWRTDIPIGDGRTSAGYICSNCGKDYWHGNVFDYCPNCGARMKGGDTE